MDSDDDMFRACSQPSQPISLSPASSHELYQPSPQSSLSLDSQSQKPKEVSSLNFVFSPFCILSTRLFSIIVDPHWLQSWSESYFLSHCLSWHTFIRSVVGSVSGFGSGSVRIRFQPRKLPNILFLYPVLVEWRSIMISIHVLMT